MSEVLLVGALLTAFLGSTFLALSQRKHWQAVTGGPSLPGRAPRWLGWSLLAASFLIALLRDGGSFGILFWPMLAGFCVLMTAMLLTWSPQVIRPLAGWVAPK